MRVCDFTPKAVQGLYNLDHFEHPSGAFIQRSHYLPVYWVYQDSAGKQRNYDTFEELKAAVEGDEQ